ncbi:hypothetical protein [Actinopolyspora xinjiangensis]|nr:hypothetical protein [Actinopolyspora xinjiangensis]
MRPFPTPAEYGKWDVLPADPPDSELDLTNEDVKHALERRETLKMDWHADWHYPHGVWRPDTIEQHPELAEAWRNWFLRRSWEGIAFINGCLVRWSQTPPTASRPTGGVSYSVPVSSPDHSGSGTSRTAPRPDRPASYTSGISPS